jgi:hypothetical protein
LELSAAVGDRVTEREDAQSAIARIMRRAGHGARE